jgi:hypothetical protein
MRPELVVYPNDTTMSIQRIAESLKDFNSILCDQRIKSIILTKLQEAELFSYMLIKQEDPIIDTPSQET